MLNQWRRLEGKVNGKDSREDEFGEKNILILEMALANY